MPPSRTTIAPARPATARRADLLDRARAAALVATRVPSPDPHGSLAALDDVLAATATDEPGLRAPVLRLDLLARVLLSAEPGHAAAGTEPAVEDRLDELLALVAEHG